MTCPACSSESSQYKLKLVSANQYKQLPHAPRYIPMIREECSSCGRWLRWAPQDEKLIGQLNAALFEMTLEAGL